MIITVLKQIETITNTEARCSLAKCEGQLILELLINDFLQVGEPVSLAEWELLFSCWEIGYFILGDETPMLGTQYSRHFRRLNVLYFIL